MEIFSIIGIFIASIVFLFGILLKAIKRIYFFFQQKNNETQVQVPLNKSQITNLNNYNQFKIVSKYNLPNELLSKNLEMYAIIEYCDARGEKSKRKIRINEIIPSSYNRYYIEAFCYSRKGTRTFKSSRITRIEDINSSIDFTDTTEFLVKVFRDPSLCPMNNIFQRFDSEIKMLVYVVKAYGLLTKKQRDIICSFITSLVPHDIDLEIFDEKLRKIKCSENEFDLALDKISTKSEDEIKLISSMLKKIMIERKTHKEDKLRSQRLIIEKFKFHNLFLIDVFAILV